MFINICLPAVSPAPADVWWIKASWGSGSGSSSRRIWRRSPWAAGQCTCLMFRRLRRRARTALTCLRARRPRHCLGVTLLRWLPINHRGHSLWIHLNLGKIYVVTPQLCVFTCVSDVMLASWLMSHCGLNTVPTVRGRRFFLLCFVLTHAFMFPGTIIRDKGSGCNVLSLLRVDTMAQCFILLWNTNKVVLILDKECWQLGCERWIY